jgi:hypothetical protein
VNPRFVPAILNLAVDAICRADLAAVERFVRRALDIDPQEAFASMWLSLLASLTSRGDEAIAAARRARELSDDSFYVTSSHSMCAFVHFSRGDLAAAEQEMRDGLADGVRPDDLRAIEAMNAARAGRADQAQQLVRELDAAPGLVGSSLMLAAGAALRVGEPEIAARMLERKLVRDLAPILARLAPELHPLLDRPPLMPRRSDATLIWPLEAPMIDAARHRLFKEVRIESGIPQGSDVR